MEKAGKRIDWMGPRSELTTRIAPEVHEEARALAERRGVPLAEGGRGPSGLKP